MAASPRNWSPGPSEDVSDRGDRVTGPLEYNCNFPKLSKLHRSVYLYFRRDMWRMELPGSLMFIATVAAMVLAALLIGLA